MIKLVIFDLDGVLVSTKDLHFAAFNKALETVGAAPLSVEEHILKFDGLTTRQKMSRLVSQGRINSEQESRLWIIKQVVTTELLENSIKYDSALIKILTELRQTGLKLFVATNSIRQTTETILSKLGVLDFFDGYLTNNDVLSPKPHPEIYLRCMVQGQASPKETLIIEDSAYGIEGATIAGANVMVIKQLSDVSSENILSKIHSINKNSIPFQMVRPELNVLIPMAGAGSRFEKAGYTFPKPLIEVNGKPMIQKVVESLRIQARYIYLVNSQHYEKYNLKYLLNLITPGCEIVKVEGLTEGAACTTLLAEQFIDNDSELLIANSDQLIEWDVTKFFYVIDSTQLDSSILTFEATHPKWSYAKIDSNGFVTEVAEKKPISNIATVGVYYWRTGADYVKYAKQMIKKNIRVNNEFYVCPVFNEAIADGKKVKTFKVNKMFGIGTPEDLDTFLKNNK